jgi:hypothetical protein
MPYKLIKRLNDKGAQELTLALSNDVEIAKKKNNKKHEVWLLLFDLKICDNIEFIKQKLNYVHENPYKRKWDICQSRIVYIPRSCE